MARSPAASVAALIRLPNLLISAAGVAVGAVLVLGRVALPPSVLLAMLSAMLLGAAGNTANDLYDIEADRVNRPARPLASGALSRNAALAIGGLAGGGGLFAAWWVGAPLLGMALFAVAVMLVYSPLLKPFGPAGNVAVAVVASLPLPFGAASAGYWRVGMLPFGLAALLHLAREVVKDIEDVTGDRAAVPPRRTVPILWGEPVAFTVAAAVLIAFIPVALAPWFSRAYGWRYGALASLAALGAGALIVQLLHRRLAGVSSALKALMVLGLAALLWDRL